MHEWVAKEVFDPAIRGLRAYFQGETMSNSQQDNDRRMMLTALEIKG